MDVTLTDLKKLSAVARLQQKANYPARLAADPDTGLALTVREVDGAFVCRAIPANGGAEWTAYINAQELVKVVGLLTGKQQIAVELTDTALLLDGFAVPRLSEEDWPRPPEPSDFGTVDRVSLSRETLEGLNLFAADWDARYMYNGVHFRAGAAEATDGRRLLIQPVHCEDAESVIVPSWATRYAVKLARKGETIDILLGREWCKLYGVDGAWWVMTRRVDAKYPDTKVLFAKMGKRVSKISNAEAIRGLRKLGKIHVSISGLVEVPDMPSVRIQLPGEWQCKPFSVNPAYLLDVFDAMGPGLEMRSSGNKKHPLHFTNQMGRAVALVMPMKT